jgi:hypothetical protein
MPYQAQFRTEKWIYLSDEVFYYIFKIARSKMAILGD